MGNRGILHDENRRIVRATRNSMWLICLLEFKGRRRPLMRASTYTELFFLDEAVALAAGHRPCAECRRTHYRAYLDAVDIGNAKDLDRKLKASRAAPRSVASIADLPDGTFVTLGDNDFRLIWAGALRRWAPEGYSDSTPIDDRDALVVTPDLSVTALRNGYPVQAHASV